MKIYNYMKFDVGCNETLITKTIDKYVNNITIKNALLLYSSTGYHQYELECYPEKFNLNGVICESLPCSETSPDGEEIIIDNPLFLIRDKNSRSDGTPIYIHLN